jgi:hypothetical protein
MQMAGPSRYRSQPPPERLEEVDERVGGALLRRGGLILKGAAELGVHAIEKSLSPRSASANASCDRDAHSPVRSSSNVSMQKSAQKRLLTSCGAAH